MLLHRWCHSGSPGLGGHRPGADPGLPGRLPTLLTTQSLVVRNGSAITSRLHALPPGGQEGGSQLFSNLNPAGKPEPGSVIGSALLVAGTTIGAGILAVPAISEPAGFSASAVALLGCCGYAVVTGLLFAEVTLNTMARQGAGNVSIVSMVRSTLGSSWLGLATLLYIFQHYSLLVAYITRAGEILASTTNLPLALSASVFAIGTGTACYGLPNKQLDAINGLLVGCIVVSFLGLLGLVLPSVDVSVLTRANWSAVPDTLPVLCLAFVYQNVVPVIVKDLEGDVDKIRLALALGCMLPLVMFTAWEAACLGAWSTLSHAAEAQSATVVDPVQALSSLQSGVGVLVNSFSLLAIMTSYIGFCLGLSDFLMDALQLGDGGTNSNDLSKEGLLDRFKADKQLGRAFTYVLVVLPPLALALTFPGLFFAALDIAGTYGVMTLFGILPAAMAWAQRKQTPVLSASTASLPATAGSAPVAGDVQHKPVVMVAGGEGVLAGVAGFAVLVISYELLQAAGFVG